ncbi:DNA polymerase zeta catalytic subunit isoform X2 [Magnolia sinica]|uniref:DNA polymerase zeta catalytic subunit isoform X2 n=1 Tax=Magnolia sinica TaxID=86752 RepID=UPI0026593626|nr:DNA polymerase zeta catalytic subunit isoform X2 [Magnolia sinica]
MASQSDPNTFGVRIVSIDYYMSPPIPDLDICYSTFQGGDVAEIPVIRIYGSTLSGQKTCLHVHRALPYLYVPCSDVLQTPQEGYAYTQLVSHAMEKALKLKSSAGSKRQHVHGCSLVRARRFYGYYSTEELFVKIYLYYPHEVARAATLLLVDYNLYGMGLIHLSKVKFRHPLPVNLSPRAVRHSNQYRNQCRHDTEEFPRESGSFQADSNSEACQNPAVWLSSTIPSGWMWPSATGHDCSLDQGMHLIRRQSTCELEGDASVDEILNQQCKMYTSLSQTRSEVKMVQSLVPIWEEEYERTGMHEMVKSPDCSKPTPENVLRTFSHGLEFKTALLDLCMKAQNSFSQVSLYEEDGKFVKSIRSLADSGDLHALEEHVKSSNSHGESVKCLKEETKIGSASERGSLSEEGDDAKPSDQMDGFDGLSPIVEDMVTQIPETSNPKVADCEALGILRWLASSQAMEDLSTDDELIHEAILSPLLPMTTIDKVLEKAHLDYESESQQECQDILDSVEVEEQAPRSDYHAHSVRVSTENTIPQVDGSFDDPITTAQMGNSSEVETNNEVGRSSLHSVMEDTSTGHGKHRSNKQLWGSLPFFMKKKVHEDSESSLNSNETCSDEVRNGTDASSSAGNDASMINVEAEFSGLKEGKTLTGCSVRDLMRRKRCYRVDPSEYGRHKIKKMVSAKERNEEACFSPVHHASQSVVPPIISVETTHVKSLLTDLTDHGSAVQERNSGAATCRSGAASEGSRLKPAIYNFPRYGKLPFPSCTARSLQVDAFSNENFGFNDNWRDRESIGTSAESEGFAITGPSRLVEESVEVPECFNSELGLTKYSGFGECCEVKVESYLSSSKLVESDVCSHEPELLLNGAVLKYDEDRAVSGGFHQLHTVPPSCFMNVPAESVSFVKDNYIDNKEKEGHVDTEGVLDMPSGKHTEPNYTFNANELQIENNKSREADMKIFSSGSKRTLRTDVSTGKNHMECIEMTFRRKPPTADLIDWNFGDASLAPFVENRDFLGDAGNRDMTLACDNNLQCFKGRYSDDFPPFFANICQEGKDFCHESYRSREIPNFHTENVLGIPTHYQNDGSFLFLLTPAFSPPSSNVVRQWLLQLEHHNSTDILAGTSRENIHEVLMEPSSPKYDSSLRLINEENACFSHGRSSSELQKMHTVSSCDPINPEGSRGDGFYRTLPESNSLPNVRLDLYQSSQDNNGNPETKITPSHTNRVITKSESKGNHVKVKSCSKNWQEVSQISGPDTKSKLTPLSQTGFRDPASVGAGQQLTLLSIEVLAESRANFRPDPRFDGINIIALTMQEDSSHALEVYVLLRVNNEGSCQRNLDGVSGCKVVMASEEKLLFDHFVKIICSLDPDILMGWEIQGSSLGFLAERAAHLGIGLLKNISRTPAFETKVAPSDLEDRGKGIADNLLPEAIIADPIMLEDSIIEDEWGRTHASGVHVGGRIVLNIWRLMRSEIKLNMYTVEAVAEAVLRRKIPSIPCKTLTKWFCSGFRRARFRSIEHAIERAKLNLEIMNQLDMINRTSELARVFGIDFFSVLSRGSQYRVESMFLRLAHTQNYLAISPGRHQVASQPAMECLPLVMEPESGFYTDPVVVLDFQSLYPSMIIAYNLCFCTCLGKVVPSKENTLGVSSFSPDRQIFSDLKDQILLTPNGVMYVPPKIRKGVLPRLLEEILSTRIMVKKAMKKLAPSQRVLHRIFNARQLALKLISNVTYGYTAAGFSGRMPCAELADSIVQCGRKTLETAISFVNTHENWNARVIYGDTDSMFVLLKGRTMEQAFRIGQEIASAVTAMNPNPVTLKMEKVYYPCVLLTKKRYVGYSYESPDQRKPTFDAKGIETVRRDTCAAVAKTLEQSLRILFEHQDVTLVKEYLHRQWTRILCGKVSLQDFVFAKEVRLGTYRSSSLPPAALVATKAMRADPRAEPRYGERIPYLVIHGEPGARLIDMVVDPLDLLDINSPYRLNDLYYINKQIIPALQRVFRLLGADLNRWFSEMPRPVRPTLAKFHRHTSSAGSACEFDDDNRNMISRKAPANKTRIDYYYLSKHCTLCGELVQGLNYLCDKCSKKEPVVAAAVIGRTSKLERDIQHLCAICRHCGGGDWIVESGVKCTSLACSVFYERRKVQKELQSLSAVTTEAGFYPRCMAEWF